MKRKRTWQLIEIEMATVLHYWEEPWEIPTEGVGRETLTPPLETAFIRELSARAWRLLGKHWQANQRAFVELDKLPPEGMEAMARFYARHLLKHLPESGVTEQVFWDEYMLGMLGEEHQHLEQDETLTAYLKSRIGKPGWEGFLRRVVQTLDGKASPEFALRLLYCMLWDLYPMPLRFWADSAAADFLSGVSSGFNLDKIRNTRRELGLNRDAPTIVKSFLQRPTTAECKIAVARVEIDELAAERCGLVSMVPAFCAFLKGGGKLGL